MGEKEEARSTKTSDNSFGIVGVVFGILSIVSLSLIGIVMGIIGLIFAMKQNKVMKNKWSKAGIILNIIGIVLGIIAIVFLFVFADYFAQLLGATGGLGEGAY